ncbi:hypothetical protein SUGI_0987900 [Cryptomeria japonica]|uniref:aspartic proteinase 36 n=1 Tax=Cryptomeria japonica TaxID=3369 RepID=UPI0024147C6E|nr:aspartic proteinase 36 [Cryptomeria japonica]GLJ46827.1 hypothetical protein SUGI_0987900 [Cryptomeria japonica]
MVRSGLNGCSSRARVLVIAVAALTFLLGLDGVHGVGVLNLHHKFAHKWNSSDRIKDFREHDSRRHSRILSNVDIPIGGSANPNIAGLYYAQIGLGVPAKQYFVQVDTGSDILWVSCTPCAKCPKSSGLGVRLTIYNPDNSGTVVTCGQPFCNLVNQVDNLDSCKQSDRCPYGVQYGDGSSTSGYFVKDTLQYNELVGNSQMRTENASVMFGCGSQQSGDLLQSDQALDGILGFGQANTSILSQLASAGKVRKVFAHCLDGDKGGGILAIGDVENDVPTTPLIPNQSHYNVNLKRIDIDAADLGIDPKVFETTDKQGTIIDSGTTLAYITEQAFKPLITAIMSAEPNLDYILQDGTYSFVYDGSVNEAFPTITLYFEGNLSMAVKPNDYLLLSPGNYWTIGWQNSGNQGEENKYMTILGDLLLKNKLVIYDLESQTIGWRDYNCSSSIQMKGNNGASEYVHATEISNGFLIRVGRFPVFLVSLLTIVLLQLKSL